LKFENNIQVLPFISVLLELRSKIQKCVSFNATTHSLHWTMVRPTYHGRPIQLSAFRNATSNLSSFKPISADIHRLSSKHSLPSSETQLLQLKPFGARKPLGWCPHSNSSLVGTSHACQASKKDITFKFKSRRGK